MNKCIKLAFSLALSTVAVSANAGLISGEQSFQNSQGQAQQVNLQGLEWLSLDHTFGIAREDIENQAWTDNNGTTWQAGDWRFATRQETNDLINSIWGGTFDGWGHSNYQGVSWFDENFGLINGSHSDSGFVDYQFAWFNYGQTNECITDASQTCQGYIALAEDYVGSALASNNVNRPGQFAVGYDTFVHDGLGYVSEYWSGSEVGLTSRAFSTRINERFASVGSFLVRAEVPEPAPIALLASGLIAFGFIRKNKRKKTVKGA